ncbi:transposase [Mycolicibacterium agri]|uniref:Transposase n=1 Tax=Mycolicibacterium agri TaxID=36811 RepID=A0A2A7MNP0_MYCAG|nr:transposase [Mycolicibacterium agri]
MSEFSVDWTLATADLLSAAAPWRTFRWYRGQKHYSGTYWSSTEQSHVIYESRLELARLLYADYDEAVRRIVAQPFLLKAKVGRRVCRHVPDFALLTKQGPLIVDVKPRARLSDPRIGATLDWTRQLVEGRGWCYEVWSEPPVTELSNVRFLAGFRQRRCFDVTLLDEVRDRDLSGRTLGEALSADFGRSRELVRSAVFHLVWNHYLTVDVAAPLTSSTMLMKGPHCD